MFPWEQSGGGGDLRTHPIGNETGEQITDFKREEARDSGLRGRSKWPQEAHLCKDPGWETDMDNVSNEAMKMLPKRVHFKPDGEQEYSHLMTVPSKNFPIYISPAHSPPTAQILKWSKIEASK